MPLLEDINIRKVTYSLDYGIIIEPINEYMYNVIFYKNFKF